MALIRIYIRCQSQQTSLKIQLQDLFFYFFGAIGHVFNLQLAFAFFFYNKPNAWEKINLGLLIFGNSWTFYQVKRSIKPTNVE